MKRNLWNLTLQSDGGKIDLSFPGATVKTEFHCECQCPNPDYFFKFFNRNRIARAFQQFLDDYGSEMYELKFQEFFGNAATDERNPAPRARTSNTDAFDNESVQQNPFLINSPNPIDSDQSDVCDERNASESSELNALMSSCNFANPVETTSNKLQRPQQLQIIKLESVTPQHSNTIPSENEKEVVAGNANFELENVDAISSHGDQRNQPIELPTPDFLAKPLKLSKDSIDARVSGDYEPEQVNGGDNLYNEIRMQNNELRSQQRKRGPHKLIDASNNEKRVKCDFCEYSTVNKGHLTTHMRTHSDDRPYECQFCGKKFARKDSLTRHMKTHREKFAYECSNCRLVFEQEKSWKSHESECKRYECYLCAKKFYHRKSNLAHHMRSMHTGEKPHKCSHCRKRFCSAWNLSRHFKRSHKEGN